MISFVLGNNCHRRNGPNLRLKGEQLPEAMHPDSPSSPHLLQVLGSSMYKPSKPQSSRTEGRNSESPPFCREMESCSKFNFRSYSY